MIAFAVLIFGLSFTSESFFSISNFLNVMRQVSPVMIAGVGMTLILASGGIDLSIGSVVALTAVLVASSVSAGLPIPVIILIPILLGVVIGAINSFFVIRGVPAFIVTLGMMTTLRGVAFVYSDGYSYRVSNRALLSLGRGWPLGVPTPVWIALGVALVVFLLVKYSRFGIYVRAIGSYEQGAKNQGISVERVKFYVYTIGSLLAVLAGIVITARLGNGTPNAGEGFALDVITAVVLGGTSLFGGNAKIPGTIIGALFVGFARNGLNLMGVSPFWSQVVTGLILVIAVFFNTRVRTQLEEIIRLAELKEEVEE